MPHAQPPLRNRVRESQERRPRTQRAWLVAILGYLLLLAFSPTKVGKPFWALLAFLVLPGLIGLATAGTPPTGESIRASLRITAWSMFIYTFVSLINVHRHVETSSGSQVFWVELFVSLVYAALAGGIAAGANALRGKVAMNNRGTNR